MKRAAVATFRYAFDHRADLLAALVYGCLAYLSFSALADYANRHDLFPEPYGGWAFAVAIDGSVLYAFISFKRAPWMAGALLVAGAASTYTLQRWHAEEVDHPLIVAGVVPGLMVLVTLAWHMIRETPTPKPIRETAGVGEREREAGPTTTPPAPAAKPAPVSRVSGAEQERESVATTALPAPAAKAAATPSRVAPKARGGGAPDRLPERTRAIREHLDEDLNRSTRQIEEALKSTPGLVGERSAFNRLVASLREEMRVEGNGKPERAEVGA